MATERSGPAWCHWTKAEPGNRVNVSKAKREEDGDREGLDLSTHRFKPLVKALLYSTMLERHAGLG